MANQAAAGWYADPNNPGQRRYWDGTKWTEHTDAPGLQQPQPAQQAQQAQQAQRPAVAAQPQAPAVQQPQAAAVAQPQRPVYAGAGGGAGAAKPGHPGIGIAGFICGLVGLILSITIVCWFIGLPLAIVGAVLGALGVRQANEKGAPKGLSMAGMICGIVGVVTGVVITVLVIVL